MDENINSTKTREETDRKCPACGGTMDFDPATGGLHCPFCDHQEEIKQVEAALEQDFTAAEETGSFNWGAEKKTVTCKSCGAVSVYDALQISDECPYCGSNQVMEEKGADSLAPGGVVTFKITMQQAGERFVGWIKKKLFCPSKAKKSAKAEHFKGVYLPYWTFDANTSTMYSGSYGIDRTYTDSDGDTHTTTDWYSTSGTYEAFVDDQPVLASTQHDEAMLDEIQPYDTARNLAYKPEYVAGFVSERYSIGLKEGWERAKKKIKKWLESKIENKIMREHNADHARVEKMSTIYSNVKYKYLLLPVWLSSFTYKGKVYQFFVNGETGKVAGKSPVSALRVTIAVLIALAVIAAAIWFYTQVD